MAVIQGISHSKILEFENKLKIAQSKESLFIEIVNTIRSILPCNQAFLFEESRIFSLIAISDVVDFDKNASTATSIEEIASQFIRKNINNFNMTMVTRRIALDKDVSFFDNFFWIKIKPIHLKKNFYLVLNREAKFSNTEIESLQLVASSLSYYLGYFYQRTPLRSFIAKTSSKLKLLILGLAFLVISFSSLYKVPIQGFAEAEVIPTQSISINSPAAGKIKNIFFKNNEYVQAGEIIIELDSLKNQTDYTNSLTRLRSLNFELNQAKKIAAIDIEQKKLISKLKDEISYQKNEINFYENILKETSIIAPVDGILLIDNQEKIIDVPFSMGQKIAEIINPTSQRLKIKKPVTSGINLELGIKATFFLTSNPFKTYEAYVHDFSYKPILGMDGNLYFEIIADIVSAEVLQVGARGTARIYSDEIPLILYWFRKPAVYIRHYYCGIFTC